MKFKTESPILQYIGVVKGMLVNAQFAHVT
jgi:hypothetical protein